MALNRNAIFFNFAWLSANSLVFQETKAELRFINFEWRIAKEEFQRFNTEGTFLCLIL